jgi:predicted ATP-dependent endonuclease of OLD family
MLTSLKLRNFKCFNEAEFEFGNFTILAGGNAVGKSSVIQALLFFAYAEMNPMGYIDIRKIYDLDLGAAKSLISHNPSGDGSCIEITAMDNGNLENVLFKTTEESPYTMEINASSGKYKQPYIKYLKAERLGLRVFSQISGSPDDLGYSG